MPAAIAAARDIGQGRARPAWRRRDRLAVAATLADSVPKKRSSAAVGEQGVSASKEDPVIARAGRRSSRLDSGEVSVLHLAGHAIERDRTWFAACGGGGMEARVTDSSQARSCGVLGAFFGCGNRGAERQRSPEQQHGAPLPPQNTMRVRARRPGIP